MSMDAKPLIVASTLILLALAAPSSNAAVCSTSNGCDFWDSQYHEFILFDWDTAALDVLIVPPASPYALRDIATIEKSVDAWEAGIQTEGASWLTSGLTIDRHTLGSGVPATDMLTDPEIIIVSAEFNPALLFGVGLSRDSACAIVFDILPFLQAGELPPDFHQHPGSQWGVTQVQCENGDNVCLVLNTNFLHTPVVSLVGHQGQRRMYDLNSHEFGHCLGIGHVGDALDFDARTVPLDDIMSYQFNPSQVHCVSTLNVRSIEGTFAKVLGRPSSEWLDFGDYVHMDPADYDTVSCTNP